MEELFNANQFCGMKVKEKRMWFVVEQLFPGHKHTIKDWIRMVQAHGVEVNS